MSPHSREVIEKFCELCDWLLQVWQMRKCLFDENPDESVLRDPRYAHFFYRLQVVLQENWLHQLAKLHDPAVQGGANRRIKLSIDYIIENGQWDAQTVAKLRDLKLKMSSLAKPVRDARNKVLSHNDLAVLMKSDQLGAFEPGEDERYFNNLREFASLVSGSVLGEPFIYDDLVKNDVSIFMHAFLRGADLKSCGE
jgi:AbiU2